VAQFPTLFRRECGKGWGMVAAFCCRINRAAWGVGEFAGGYVCAGAGEHMGLPSGRPAREAVLGGDPGGKLGKRFRRTLMRECSLALVGDHGEASADYLHRCHIRRKVARFFFDGPAKSRIGMKMGEMRRYGGDRRTAFLEARPKTEMLYPAMVVSHPCDRQKSQGWGTELWGTAIMVPL
jgi:hypothetical protein